MNWKGTDEGTMADSHADITTSAISKRGLAPDGSRRKSDRRVGSLVMKGLALAAVAAAAAWAYSANFGPGRPVMDMGMRVTSGAAPFPVVTAPVERGDLAASVTYTGTVAPFNDEDVYPRVTGRIIEMAVYPGDAVRPGQVVARLDDVELSSRLRESEAMLVTAEANRAQMETDLTAARHGVVQMERELAMAEVEHGYAMSVAVRSERLVASGAISRQEHENERSIAAALEAKREAALAKLEQARAMEAAVRRKVDAAGSMVAQAQAQFRTAQVVRDYVDIVTPGPGHVVKRLVAPGTLVQPGMPILKIAQMDRVRLQAHVGERDLASIRVGAPVQVMPEPASHSQFNARVTAVFPFVDPGARTAVVEATVPNPGGRLLPGQYVRMRFITQERRATLLVPSGAVTRRGGKPTVWVDKDGVAESRAVTLGLEAPGAIEIAEGLEVGERVVVRGQGGLYAGARLSDVSSPAGTPAAEHSGHRPSTGTDGEGGSGPAPSRPSGTPVKSEEKGHAGH